MPKLEEDMSKLVIYGHGRASSKREIQRVLDSKGKNFVDVAQMAGVSRQTVSNTMNGYRHCSRVLDVLRNLGVSEDLLFDPRHSKAV